MSEAKSYPAPWDFIGALFPHVPRRTRASQAVLSAMLVRRLQPAPVIECAWYIPSHPRFVVVANHYQRRGLWIAYPAAVITQAMAARFGPGEPALRWIVTANWPPWKIGRLRIASPGDILLPRVANALWCYDVPFAGSDPARTGVSLRRLLRDAKTASRPFGLFPEGAAGTADRLAPALAGTDRLIALLARQGFAVLPARVYEADCLKVRFGRPISSVELLNAPDPAELAMERVRCIVP